MWNEYENYEGDWENNIISGTGVQRWQDKKYEGQFKEGLFQGRGKLIFALGDQYEGEFNKGLKHGQIRYTDRNKKVFD